MNIDTKFKFLYKQLSGNAIVYFRTGFDIVKNSSLIRSSTQIQVAIGNICIAIELLLKAYIAQIHPILVFKNMPEDIKLYLLNSTKIPTAIANRNQAPLLINYEDFETIDFQKAISLLSIYCPDFYSTNKHYFKDINVIRNSCIHNTFHEFNAIQYNRIVYLAIILFRELNKELQNTSIDELNSDKSINFFIKEYQDSVAQALHEKIRLIRAKVLKKDSSMATISDPFSEYVSECPICESTIIVNGSTSAQYTLDDEGFPVDVDLSFEPDYFTCKNCGLNIEDYEEFLLLNFYDCFDMHDLKDEWMSEHI